MNVPAENHAADLEWLAFRYVADELPDDERLRFEERLDEDQSAREAVAHAVELSQAIAFVESERRSAVACRADERSAWGARLTWMVAGGVLCLALVVGIQQLAMRYGTSPDHEAPNGVAANLASAWGELRVRLHEDPELWPAADNALIDEPILDEGLMAAESSSDAEGDLLSNWIAVAVVGLSGQAAGEASDDGGKGL